MTIIIISIEFNWDWRMYECIRYKKTRQGNQRRTEKKYD